MLKSNKKNHLVVTIYVFILLLLCSCNAKDTSSTDSNSSETPDIEVQSNLPTTNETNNTTTNETNNTTTNETNNTTMYNIDNQTNLTMTYDIIKYIPSVTYDADWCFVNDELWKFTTGSDDHSKKGYVFKLKYDWNTMTFTNEGFIMHNLGHCNTVSYNQSTDSLILGNGGQSYSLPGQIYILQNVSQRDELKIEDCIIIDLNYYSKVQALFSDIEDNIIYIIANNNTYYAKFKLEFKENKYTGNYTIIEEHIISETTDVNQGSICYKGDIFHGFGHNKINIFKCEINEYFKREKITINNLEEYDLNDNFVQAIEIKNDYIFLGCSNCIIIIKMNFSKATNELEM